MYNLERIRADFPMLKAKDRNGNNLIYLDNAGTTFKPFSVIRAIDDFYMNCSANTHSEDYDIGYKAYEDSEKVREKVAKFINAERKEIVFTSGASMSINLIAYGYGVKYLKKDDEILITEAEHASNVLPWFKVAEITGARVKYIPLTKEGRLTAENLRKTISKKTKIVAVAHVTNVLGYVVDIKSLAKIAHENGAIIAVDGAQSVPHIKTDVKDLDVDFLSFSGHKMCAPMGIGVLYGKYELLDITDPFLTGGGMNAKFDMCGDVKYLTAPIKFEAGTKNVEGIIGLGAAIDYLSEIGLDNISKHEQDIRKYAITKMKEIPGVEIYNETAEAGIITFNLKDVFAQDEGTYLNSQGICVRTGQHCAKILIDFLKTVATIRVSIYLYTSREDIDRFIEALEKGGDYLNAYFH